MASRSLEKPNNRPMKYLRLSEYSKNFKIASLVIASTIIVTAGLIYFGGAIAAVFIPLIVVAIAAYRVHVRRLEINAAQLESANRIHMATVEALATAIDARDQVGFDHVRRTQIYAVGMGNIIGLPINEINALRSGALLHDIGKLAVPDHILSKTSPLTDAEFEKAKIHTTVGASILENIDFMFPVAPIVLSHHENWDGTGYPHGISGNDIPLTARILSVADAYDTQRSDRPYRDAVTREKARRSISEGSGTKFDPAIVQTFLKHLSAFEDEIEAAGLGYQSKTVRTPLDENATYVDQIKQANKEAYTLYQLSREFGSVMKFDETIALFSKKIGEFVQFNTCIVYLLDPSGRYADAVHVVGDNSEELLLRRVRTSEGATGFVLKNGERVANINPDLDFSHLAVEFGDEYLTMASLPLYASEELIGAVSIYSKELPFYESEHLRLLETVSRIAAEAIGKSKTHDEATVHALTDPMTGLPNARSLQLHFDREVSRSDRSGAGFQVLMLDLDRFKAVNDSFGHKVGDRMLLEIGQVILDQLREYDFLARYGGDEFVAVVADADDAVVSDLCDRIERAVAAFKLDVGDGSMASVGISPGAAYYGANGETFDDIIIAADKAMYERKARRKRITSGKPAVDSRSMSDLVTAISSDLVDMGSNQFLGEDLIVELDDSHVLHSVAVN